MEEKWYLFKKIINILIILKKKKFTQNVHTPTHSLWTTNNWQLESVQILCEINRVTFILYVYMHKLSLIQIKFNPPTDSKCAVHMFPQICITIKTFTCTLHLFWTQFLSMPFKCGIKCNVILRTRSFRVLSAD